MTLRDLTESRSQRPEFARSVSRSGLPREACSLEIGSLWRLFSPFGRLSAGYLRRMLIVHVHVRVKPDFVEAFRVASLANAEASRREPGIARFDVLQQADDPTRFVLSEAYRSPEAPAAHKETAHYAAWRDTVAEMMAEPRQSVKFANADPPDEKF